MNDQEVARISFSTFFIHSEDCQLKLQCTQKDKISYIFHFKKKRRGS